MYIIDAARVRALLPMSECIEVMKEAMVAVSAGTLSMPARLIMPLVDKSAYLGVMPGSLMKPRVYGAKIVSLHPANASIGLPIIQGFVALFDHATGTPVALVDGAEITALRTGAASGLATDRLARPEASTLGLFGSGVQAGSHLEAICTVRKIEEVRVWSRSWESACNFVERHVAGSRARLVPVRDPGSAASCDVVCATTAAAKPILRGEWVRPGAHVNLVGAHTATTREADTALIKRARVYVDSLQAALIEAGDILIPISEGVLKSSDVVGEIGSVLLGELVGRINDEEVTVYKSVGLVAQDLAAASVVYSRVQSG